MFNVKEYYRQYYIIYKQKIDERSKQWRKDNFGYMKQWHRNHIGYNKQYHKDSREEARKYMNQYIKTKRKTDLKINLNHRISNAISKALKGNKKGRRWEELVGYNLDTLMNRLLQTMPKGYTWQDFLEGKLHIDHVIPKSIFNYNCSEHIDFRRCRALKNLQLLPAKENISKYNKLNKSFQPALMF